MMNEGYDATTALAAALKAARAATEAARARAAAGDVPEDKTKIVVESNPSVEKTIEIYKDQKNFGVINNAYKALLVKLEKKSVNNVIFNIDKIDRNKNSINITQTPYDSEFLRIRGPIGTKFKLNNAELPKNIKVSFLYNKVTTYSDVSHTKYDTSSEYIITENNRKNGYGPLLNVTHIATANDPIKSGTFGTITFTATLPKDKDGKITIYTTNMFIAFYASK